MPSLLHEYWEDDDGTGGEFGPVIEHNDKTRPMRSPTAGLVFSLCAASWHEAMQMYQDRLGYGEFVPGPEPDHFYTDAEKAEQDAYLQIRHAR